MADNSLTVIGGMKISTKAKQSKYADQELGAGIAAPFAVIGFKGGRWAIKSRGTTHVLERRDAQGRPDGFVPYLDVVILLAASHHSKVYYAKTYQDGDEGVPDCWSTDGTKPDQAAPQKQSPTCANCKWNEFGSRINLQTGKASGKACSDTRRMAVVPYNDIENTLLGGPMLLRVPPASLGSVGEYSDLLKANSVPYSAIATRLGFDKEQAYPRIVFAPLAALTDAEMDRVIKMQAHPLVERIVQEQVENVSASVSDAPVIPPAAANGQHGTAVTRPVTEPVQQVQPPPTSPTSQPAEAPPAPSLTPEQAKIRELEDQLAAAKAASAPATRPTRRRSQPVAPSAQAEPHQPVEAAGEEDGSGSGAAVAAGGSDPALDSITARLSKILS
jgi:hypothetical protein